MIYIDTKRAPPADFDGGIFDQIYGMLVEFRNDVWSVAEAQAFWAPMVAHIRQMRIPPAPAQAPNNEDNPPNDGDAQNDGDVPNDGVADVEMEEDTDNSVLELSLEDESVEV